MIDLFSDTMTRPTEGMRRAMAAAEVGDEQFDEDPTTLLLEERAAELLGQDSSLFLISATMANAIAVWLHCGPGDELLAAENGHVLGYEAGSSAVHARAQAHGIPTPDGTFTGRDIEARTRPSMPHCPRPTLVVAENTTNHGGGVPWEPEKLRDVRETAGRLGLALHLDGARLLNAATFCGLPAKELAVGFDTVTLCFSKGLGAPVGAVLGLSFDQKSRARRLKHMLGGAMRQSGVIAAACLYALDHHVDRLRQDHEHAALLAEGLGKLSGLKVEPNPRRTNMVFFSVEGIDPVQFAQAVKSHGVRYSPAGSSRFRAVTHLDVVRADIDKAVERTGHALRDLRAARV